MPQGPGTYGKQVGRPPKKKSPTPYTPFKMRGSPMQRNFPDYIKPGDSPNKFSWEGALSGGVTGGSVGGPWGALAGGLIGGFTAKKKKKEEVKEANLDPESKDDIIADLTMQVEKIKQTT